MLRRLFWIGLVATVGALIGVGAANALTALIDGDTVSGSPSQEEQAATAQGYTVTVVGGATWAGMTQAQFGAYDLLIIGDPTCNSTPENAAANAATWAPVVMGTAGGRTQPGNRVLIGTDPVYHDSGYLSSRATIIRDGITFAGKQAGRTGLYFDASCTGGGGNVLSALSLLSTGSGSWTNNGAPPCGGNVSLIASEPSFGAPDTLTTASLEGWGCSVHESWPTFPTDWSALAVATDTSTTPTCGVDPNTMLSACGQAYILIAGSSIVVASGSIAVTPTDATNPVGTSHTVTAYVTSGGSPLVGQLVTFTVTGQNAGAVGVCSPADCTSDANGDVTFTYTDTNGAGDDTIKASFTDGTGSLQSATAQKHWVAPAACGNGVVDPGEQCDDGNTSDGDCCSADCQTATAAGTPCDLDANLCTTDQCNGTGTCVFVANVSCAAASQCNGGEICNPGTGACDPQPNPPAGTPCDLDANLCTTDQCDGAGTCAFVANVSCAAANPPCDGGEMCNPGTGACDPQPDASAGTPCEADGNLCTHDQCNGSGSCVLLSTVTCTALDQCHVAGICDPGSGVCANPNKPDGQACNDGDICTQIDQCIDGVCTGSAVGADTDGDGYCDLFENQQGCDPTDPREIPPQAPTYGGSGSGRPSVLTSYSGPSGPRITVATDPSCATAGVCGPAPLGFVKGFCKAGKIADPCTTNADCDLPANTCRLVVNYAAVPDLKLDYAFLNRPNDPVAGFTPLHPGCSRKVDIALDPTRRANRLRLRAEGTVFKRHGTRRERFSYR